MNKLIQSAGWLLLVLMGGGLARAQTITAYEYWFDDAHEARQTQSVAPTPVVEIDQSISLSSLTGGPHRLRFRFQDNEGRWSSVRTHVIHHTGLLTEVEYWFDGSFGSRQSRTLTPGMSLDVNELVEVTAAADGFHTVFMRFRDEGGNWSSPLSQNIVCNGGDVSALEYWFDGAFHQRESLAVTPGQIVDVDALIDQPAGGFHELCVRYRDQAGNWSGVFRRMYVMASQDNHVTGVYYWVNDRYDERRFLPMTGGANPVAVDTLLALGGWNLPFDSLATLYVRYQDATGELGPAYAHVFENCNTPRLERILPARGGNLGIVNCVLEGHCLPANGTVFLRRKGYPDLVADTVAEMGVRRLGLIFDLHDVAPGLWDVVLKWDADSLTLPEAFTVEAGKLDLVVDILGRDRIRTGAASFFQIAVTNNGNYDALGVPVFIATAQNVNISFEDLVMLPEVDEPYPQDSLPIWYPMDHFNGAPFAGKVCWLHIPVVPSGRTIYLNLRVVSPETQEFQLYAAVAPPTLGSGPTPEQLECLKAYWKVVAEIVGIVAGPEYTCALDLLRVGAEAMGKYSMINTTTYTKKQYAWDMSKQLLQVVVVCGVRLGLKPWSIMRQLISNADRIIDAFDIAVNCWQHNAHKASQVKQVSSRTSLDPNEKTGPPGVGGTNVLSGLRPMQYAVYFENKDTLINGMPTLPAQRVLIIDTLDKMKFDLRTFAWSEVHFGSYLLKAPAAADTFTATVEMRPERNLQVRVTGTLDTVSGVARWVLEAVDPLTGRPIDDPDDGFLPPNTVSPEGEGYVSFSVHPRADVAPGTPVRNRASITFDFNAPILTNTYVNRFDFIKPQSQITSVTHGANDSTYMVRWTASDVGVGVRHVSIWAAEPGQPYKRFVPNASGNEATFVGSPGVTYALYSIAQDSVYNTEDAPAGPDTVINARPERSPIAQLFQNQPNPFSDVTYIHYSLTQPIVVTLVITDLYGRTVRTLEHNIRKTPGMHTAVLQAGDLASGSYFCILETAEGRQVRRLLLIR